MSVPAEVMQQAQAPVPVQQPAAPAADGGSPAPSPVSQPSQNAGAEAAGRVSVQTALLLLHNAIPAFAPGSKEGMALLDVAKKLAIQFGSDASAQQLAPAQIMQLVRSMQSGNPVQAPTPPQ